MRTILNKIKQDRSFVCAKADSVPLPKKFNFFRGQERKLKQIHSALGSQRKSN